MKVDLDLCDYTTKSDLEKKLRVDKSKFVKKDDLPGLTTDLDELDITEYKLFLLLWRN